MAQYWSRLVSGACVVGGLLLGGGLACAEDVVKIGFLATVSGPAGTPGQHMRDGFLLGVKEKGGRLGGVKTSVLVEDAALDPAQALGKARQLVEKEKVNIMVGVVFSSIMNAVYRPIVDSNTIFIGSGAGPSYIAGKDCSRYFFSTGFEDEQTHQTMGSYASIKGYQTIALLAPDYPPGKRAVAAFKRHYKGEVLDVLYVKPGKTDFTRELARIGELGASAVFAFMPGRMGLALMKQYNKSGFKGRVPFLSTYMVDETSLPMIGEAGESFYSGAVWAYDLKNDANERFVRGFEAEYGYAPSTYAAQGYDAAMLVDGALDLAGGVGDMETLLSTLRASPFSSVRGDFHFNSNQFPIQDFYAVQAVKDRSSKYVTHVMERVFDDIGDDYSGLCRM